MSAHASKLVLTLALALVGSACSLVNLSDEISQANCKTDADCDVLNDRAASTFDACELWQCGETKLCEFTPLDGDKDGFTPHTVSVDGEDLVCEAKPEKQDCDDDSSARRPGGKERCDDVDNDCDSQVDEGVLDARVADAVTFGGDDAQGAGQLSYAIDPASGQLALSYSINRDPAVVGLSVLDNALPSGATASAVKLNGMPAAALLTDGVGVAALGEGRFAIAFYNTDGAKKRVVAGRMDASQATLLMTDDVRTGGLHCTEDELTGCETTTTPATRPPALAALDDDVLVSYVRAAADPGAGCKQKSDSVATHPLLANLLTVASDGLEELSDHAVLIGETTSLEAPAVLALADPLNGKTFGFLVGYVDDAGAIVWKNVRAEGSSLVVSGVLAKLESGKQRYTGVHAALGPRTDDGQLIGLSFQSGCTVDARVGVALLLANVNDSGAPTLQTQLGEKLVGGAPNEKDATLAFSKERDSWAVAYRDPKGLRARVLDRAGNPLGEAAYVLVDEVDEGAAMTKLFLTPAIVPTLASGGWFGVVAYAERAGQDPRALVSATLSGCGAQE